MSRHTNFSIFFSLTPIFHFSAPFSSVGSDIPWCNHLITSILNCLSYPTHSSPTPFEAICSVNPTVRFFTTVDASKWKWRKRTSNWQLLLHHSAVSSTADAPGFFNNRQRLLLLSWYGPIRCTELCQSCRRRATILWGPNRTPLMDQRSTHEVPQNMGSHRTETSLWLPHPAWTSVSTHSAW